MAVVACSNNTTDLKPLFSYTFKVEKDESVGDFISDLQTKIDTNQIRKILNGSQDNKYASGLGVRYSTYNPETNCFVNTKSCKEFVVAIHVDPKELAMPNENINSSLGKYIENLYIAVSHNNAPQSTQ